MNYSNIVEVDKTVLIDYITVSMDFFGIEEVSPRFWQIKETLLFDQLLDILGHKGGAITLSRDTTLHGFTEGFRISEHIRLFYGGNNIVSADGKHPLLLEMTGQACREFENYQNGNWLELMEFLIQNQFFRVTRFDIAIDDYTGKEIKFKDIMKLYELKSFTTRSRSAMYIRKDNIFSDYLESAGQSLYIGVRGGNHLVIYDKYNELKQKGMRSKIVSDYHFRYEMRFVDDKAKAVLENYYANSVNNNSEEFMKFAVSLLQQFIDLKDPEDKKVKRRTRRIYKKWELFLEKVQKSKLTVKTPEEITLEAKDYWMEESMTTTMLEQFSTKGIPGGLAFLLELGAEAIKDDLKNKKIVRINKTRSRNGLPELSRNDLDKLKETILNIRDLYLNSPDTNEIAKEETTLEDVDYGDLRKYLINIFIELQGTIAKLNYADDEEYDYISLDGVIYKFKITDGKTSRFDPFNGMFYIRKEDAIDSTKIKMLIINELSTINMIKNKSDVG